MQRSSTTPGEHIASLPDDVHGDIAALDARITEVMGDAVVWEGRSWGAAHHGYGEYNYTGRSGRSGEWFIVGLAAQKNYITVFVNAVEGGSYLAERYVERLGKAKVGKSSISFKRLSDIDLDVLLELVGRAHEPWRGRLDPGPAGSRDRARSTARGSSGLSNVSPTPQGRRS